MAKFLGVISTQYQKPSDDLVLEYSDLNMIADYLISETENQFHDFQHKCQAMNEQEIELTNNLTKIKEITEVKNCIQNKTLEMEQESDNICLITNIIEGVLAYLESIPSNFCICPGKVNLERRSIGEKLIKMSEEDMKMQNCVNELKDLTCSNTPSTLTKHLPLFLDYYTRILENIELKCDKITDQIKEVDELFQHEYQKRTGTGYHKINYDSSSSYC